MLSRRKKVAPICLVMFFAITVLTSGCQILSQDNEEERETASAVTSEAESETNTESETEAKTETEATSESEMESETETESETEFRTDVEYISEDASIRIVLPDSTWNATQDVDEMRIFSSGSDAMISIVHAADESSMDSISVMKTADELEESLVNQYPGEDAYEILLFEERSSSAVVTYEYVVKYNYSASMWASSVTWAILSADGDAAYVVSGTVAEDDEELLDAVLTSVESFSVLDEDSIFYVLPDSDGASEENEPETETETETETEGDSSADGELATLIEYSTEVTLYTSSDVNIRELPSTGSERIGSLTEGNPVSVTGETTQWFQVMASGGVGYISKAYLVSAQTEMDTEEDTEGSDESVSSVISDEFASEVTYETSCTCYTTASVNVRSQPGTDSSIVSGLASETAVTVTGETDGWYVVSIDGVTGYISKAYVSSVQASTTDESSTSETTEEEASETVVSSEVLPEETSNLSSE